MAEKTGIAFDMDTEVYQKAKDEAERLGIPLAGFLRQLVVRYFDRQEEYDTGSSNTEGAVTVKVRAGESEEGRS